MLADLEEFRKNPSINFDYSAAEFDPEEELDDDRTVSLRLLQHLGDDGIPQEGEHQHHKEEHGRRRQDDGPDRPP